MSKILRSRVWSAPKHSILVNMKTSQSVIDVGWNSVGKLLTWSDLSYYLSSSFLLLLIFRSLSSFFSVCLNSNKMGREQSIQSVIIAILCLFLISSQCSALTSACVCVWARRINLLISIIKMNKRSKENISFWKIVRRKHLEPFVERYTWYFISLFIRIYLPKCCHFEEIVAFPLNNYHPMEVNQSEHWNWLMSVFLNSPCHRTPHLIWKIIKTLLISIKLPCQNRRRDKPRAKQANSVSQRHCLLHTRIEFRKNEWRRMIQWNSIYNRAPNGTRPHTHGHISVHRRTASKAKQTNWEEDARLHMQCMRTI